MFRPKVPIFLLIIISIIFSYSNTTIAATQITIKSGHPRIMLHSGNLAEMQAKVAIGGIKHNEYDTILAWCDTNYGNMTAQKVPVYAGEVLADAGELRYALIYALGAIPGHSYGHTIAEYGAQAVLIAKQRITDNVSCPTVDCDYLKTVSIAYDWCYPLLTAQDKTAIVNWLKSKVGTLDVATQIQRPGYRFSSTPACLYPGLAFHGDGVDDPTAANYFTFAINDWIGGDALAAFHMSGKDGGHAAGAGYAKGYYPAYYKNHEAFYALYTATTGKTLSQWFGEYTYMDGIPIWLLHSARPGPPRPAAMTSQQKTAMHTFGDQGNPAGWNFRKNEYQLGAVFRLLAHVAHELGDDIKAGWITWMINNVIEGSMATTFDLLFDDKPAEVTPTNAGLPTTKVFGWDTANGVIDSYLTKTKAGVGEVYMRSDWAGIAASSSNTTYASFKASPFYYFGHMHSDALAFTIWKGDALADPQMAYYNYYEGTAIDYNLGGGVCSVGYPIQWYHQKRGLGENTILVIDPNETVYTQYSEQASDPLYKDGAQRAFFDGTYPYAAVQVGSVMDTGGLIKYEDGNNFTYSSADATKAYCTNVGGTNYCSHSGTSKVDLVQRDFVYSKSSDGTGDYLIVFDRVASTNPTFKKVFLLHTIGEPVLNDVSPIQIYGNGSNGLFSSTLTDYISFAKANSPIGKLHMKLLLPESKTVYKGGGSVTTATTGFINNTDNITCGAATMSSIPVTNTASFSDKPIVTISGTHPTWGVYNEVFMCDSKTSNTLNDCIRGPRYSAQNNAISHPTGATVTQKYNWLFRDGNGDWITHPNIFGTAEINQDYPSNLDEYGRWTLRVENGTNELATNFLNVFFPTTNLSASMPTTSLITSTDGNCRGALIADSKNPRIVMFSKTTGQVSDVTYDANYLSSQTGKHLITGLVPSGGYDIYKNGTKLSSVIASSQGVIYFESSGGAIFRLVQISGPTPPPSDATSPSVPTNLTAVAFSSSQINLSWASSTDNVGVAGYRIYRNGTQRGTSATNSYFDSGLSPSTSYSYTVVAYDLAANFSGQSGAASATTPGGGDTIPPVRSNGSPSGTLGSGTTQTTFSLTTNESATCKYSSAAGVLYPSITNTFSTTGGTSHSSTLSNLSNGTSYSYYVRCMDASKNANPDDYVISFSVGSSTPPSSPSSGYIINDYTFYPVPNIPRPAKGVQFQDQNYNTAITRITDAPTDNGQGYIPYVGQGYPKHPIENLSGDYLLLQSFGPGCGFQIWNAKPPYNWIKSVPCGMIEVNSYEGDCRWDYSNSPGKINTVYCHNGPKLYQWDVTTGPTNYSIVHDFTNDIPGYTVKYISMYEEGDSSLDSRYWAFAAVKTPDFYGDPPVAIIVYDKTVDKVISRLDQGAGTYIPGTRYYNSGVWIRGYTGTMLNPNSVGMSPDGDYVIVGGPPNWVYARDFSTSKYMGGSGNLAPHGHFSIAKDSAGAQVYLDSCTYGSGPDAAWGRMIDLAGGDSDGYLLAVQGVYTPGSPSPPGGGHWSGTAYDKPGWAVYSQYFPYAPNVPDSWDDQAVVMVELSKKANLKLPNPTSTTPMNRAWVLTHANSKVISYGDCPFGKFNNRFGTKVFFGSSWGTSWHDTPPTGQYDVYQIDLPATWYQDLMGFSILTSSPVEGTVASNYSQNLQATGGSAPYTWSVTSGSLPTGLSLNAATGAISGTPITQGTFNFGIQVSDASSPAKAATKALSITISSPGETITPASPKGLKIIN